MKISKIIYPLFLLLFVPAMAQEKPNIIVIFTDDHGWADLSVNGVVNDIKTPNLDQLAADGVRFTSGYVTAPQCVPSRAGIVSGRYQQSFGVDDNRFSPMPIDVNTVPERLQTAGYTTGHVGKWHLDPSVESVEWLENNTYAGKTLPPRNERIIPFQDKLPFKPLNQGFDEYFDGQTSSYYANYDLNGNDLNANGQTVHINGRDRLDIQTDAGLAFINRNHENPFFLYLAYFAPHVPLASSEKYLSRFPGDMPERRRYALAMISAVDEGVGRIREQLIAHNILDNTILFFIGDNGAPLDIDMEDRPLNENGWDGSLNTPFKGEKGMLSEGGIRVPYLLSWPDKIASGQVSDIPVSSLDVGATAAIAAGLEIDDDLKGKDIIELMADSDMAADRPLFWRFWSQGALRVGDWKYMIVGKTEYLFNLKEDPTESNNLVSEEPVRAAAMFTQWNTWNNTLPRERPEELNTGEFRMFSHYFDYTTPLPEGPSIWTFDCDEQKWGVFNHAMSHEITHQLSNETVNSGHLEFTHPVGNKSNWVFGPTNTPINADENKHIHFSLTLNEGGAIPETGINALFVWNIPGENNKLYTKSFNIFNGQKDYHLDLSDNANWQGLVNINRFHFPQGDHTAAGYTPETATYALDWVAVVPNADFQAPVQDTSSDCNLNIPDSDELSNIEIHLFPNPASNTIFIENASHIKALSIVNITGQVVMEFINPASLKVVDISILKEGVYFLRGTSIEGKKTHLQFIKK